MPKWIPTAPEVLREAIIVVVGALIATALVKSLPTKYASLFNLTGSQQ